MSVETLFCLLEADYGPSTWSLKNWVGVGIYAVAFLVLVRVVYRIAQPTDDVPEGSGPERGE